MQTLPLFKKDLTSLAVHSFNIHRPAKCSQLQNSSWNTASSWDTMQDVLVAVLSLLSTLYWLLVTLKIKVTTRFMRLYLPWPEVFPSTVSALATCTEHQMGQRSSTSGLCNYYSFRLECSSQRNSTDRIVHFSTSSRCVFARKCLHPPQIPMLKL